MKSLAQYIFEQSLNLTDILEKHIFIEFNQNIINESNGIYDRQSEIVKYVLKKIKNSKNNKIIISSKELDYIIKNTKIKSSYFDKLKGKNKERIKNILQDNLFFKKIELIKSNETSYLLDESYFNDDELLMDIIVITFNPNSSSLTTDLIHEFTHAWDDYNTYIKESNISLGEIADSEKYKNANKAQNDAIKINILTKSNAFDAQKFCSYAIYALSKQEQNAFKSEIHSIFIDYEKYLNNFNQAINIFKNSRSYKDFIRLQNYINSKDLTEQDKNLFVKTYNKINNTNWKWNKIYKKLNHLLLRYFTDISKYIAREYYEFINR